MKYVLAFCTALLAYGIGQAQILDNNQGKLYQGDCIFNGKFLRDNGIQSITGEISVKKEMRPITHMGTIDQYLFNEKGQLLEHIKSFRLRGGQIDTTQDYFKYNDLDHLVSKTSVMLSGYDAIRYQYDAEGNRSGQTWLRGENKSPFSFHLEKGKESIIKEESYENETVSDSIRKRVYLNAEGKPYKETLFRFNSLGHCSAENTRYYLTNKKNTITYSYDVEGRLTKIIDHSNIMGNLTLTYTYTYDELSNLTESKVHKNGKLIETRQFLYFVQTLLLKAQLIKNEESGEIKIIKYKYQYF
ncbi:RHS repeat protein [bacterium SCSIO 12741]|nr:RHS repeat protein [bacterium SCSIO 12741]